MNQRAKTGVALAAVALFGFIVYSTFQQSAETWEVCVNYKGRGHCASASGRTREEAVAAAHQIGCSLITSGRDENMACLDLPPVSVKVSKK
jgi:hypothetical protein